MRDKFQLNIETHGPHQKPHPSPHTINSFRETTTKEAVPAGPCGVRDDAAIRNLGGYGIGNAFITAHSLVLMHEAEQLERVIRRGIRM